MDDVISWCRKLLPMDEVWDKLQIAITSLERERTTINIETTMNVEDHIEANTPLG